MHDQRSGFTVIVLKVVLIDMVTVHGTACKKRKFTFCHLFLFQREIALNHPQILIEKQVSDLLTVTGFLLPAALCHKSLFFSILRHICFFLKFP